MNTLRCWEYEERSASGSIDINANVLAKDSTNNFVVLLVHLALVTIQIQNKGENDQK